MAPGPTREQFVTLKEHIESRLAAIEKSIEIADRRLQQRLDGMNEFREALQDQASKFVTREELKAELSFVRSKLEMLDAYMNKAEGKASQSQVNTATLIAIIGLIAGLINLLWTLMS